jgi:two-component system LytT family response regulator
MLKAILIDDESAPRLLLRTLLEAHPTVQVVAEAGTIADAVELIRAIRPDVIFLDVQMRGESGFDLFDRMEVEARVVFVTSHDRFAARAFDVNALDYLLKPVDPERLARTIAKLGVPPAPIPKEKLEYADRLFLRLERRTCFLRVDAIKRIRADADYSRLWTTETDDVQSNLSLKEWEDRLPDRQFLRIHRSTIINLEYVVNVEDWFNYSYRVFLNGIAEPEVVSRRYAMKLRERMP